MFSPRSFYPFFTFRSFPCLSISFSPFLYYCAFLCLSLFSVSGFHFSSFCYLVYLSYKPTPLHLLIFLLPSSLLHSLLSVPTPLFLPTSPPLTPSIHSPFISRCASQKSSLIRIFRQPVLTKLAGYSSRGLACLAETNTRLFTLLPELRLKE